MLSMEIVFLYIEMQLQEQFKYMLIRNRFADFRKVATTIRKKNMATVCHLNGDVFVLLTPFLLFIFFFLSNHNN